MSNMAGLKMAETRRQEEGEDGVVEAPLFLTDELNFVCRLTKNWPLKIQ